jgi:uracil-DNA glycosylase
VETTSDGTPVLIAYHPSYILRLPDARARAEAKASLVRDLRAAREL